MFKLLEAISGHVAEIEISDINTDGTLFLDDAKVGRILECVGSEFGFSKERGVDYRTSLYSFNLEKDGIPHYLFIAQMDVSNPSVKWSIYTEEEECCNGEVRLALNGVEV